MTFSSRHINVVEAWVRNNLWKATHGLRRALEWGQEEGNVTFVILTFPSDTRIH